MATPRASVDPGTSPRFLEQVDRRSTEELSSQQSRNEDQSQPQRRRPLHVTYASNLNDLERSNDSQPSSRRLSILPPTSAWKMLFLQEVPKDWMLEIQLFVLTISTGVLDATTYFEFKVFTTKMTGNVLFLALYVFESLDSIPNVEQNVGVAISAFLVGATCFGHIGREVKQARRSWLIAMNISQTLLVFAAAAVRGWAPRQRAGKATLGIISLLGFASSGQITMAVGVGLAAVNTVMITGSLVQLTSDKAFFSLYNRPRTRGALFCLSYLIGCFIGAACIRFRDAWVGLLLTACIKSVVALSFLFNKGWVEEEDKRAQGIATPISRILWGD